jgi:hypothetical protein
MLPSGPGDPNDEELSVRLEWHSDLEYSPPTHDGGRSHPLEHRSIYRLLLLWTLARYDRKGDIAYDQDTGTCAA